MPTWSLTALELPLRFTWKISRNASTAKTNLLVQLRDEASGPTGYGEAAPNVRYGETPAGLQAEFAALLAAGLNRVNSEAALHEFLAGQPVAHALRFALESAVVHWAAARAGRPVWQWLGVPAPAAAVPTAFTLPIMEPGAVAGFLHEQDMARFALLKIKVNQEMGYELLREVTKVLPGRPLIIDGNEAWTDPDALLQFVEQAATLPGLRVRLLEQPMPAAEEAAYRYLHGRTPWPLFADESVTDAADFGDIARQFHGVNMKLMKAGGYRNGIRILRETQAHGLHTMMGCMVETSLGIWSALQLSGLAGICDLDGLLIIRDEPFGLVQEQAGQLYPLAELPAALPVG
ncbi:enolase C-terminal domain-like protein [Hymenobacter puniceus]|uniref:enolase C-terminal domain-like protein n=1 Tax=Hymenobacter sp. BT190 TaxID=2763505 RepID=UPI001650DA09|nr:enolase C-terminal domain-like protein [Hymenobacter sp. BT190]MBC6697959.1 dipeptide epimerase [Hymenobacter sp. BT190]